MTSTPIRSLTVPADAINGPNATGVVRTWVEGRGEITVVKTAGMDTTAKLNVDDTAEALELDDDVGDEPRWVKRHSVNCIQCGERVDERVCMPGPDGEGDICPDCQDCQGPPVLSRSVTHTFR